DAVQREDPSGLFGQLIDRARDETEILPPLGNAVGIQRINAQEILDRPGFPVAGADALAPSLVAQQVRCDPEDIGIRHRRLALRIAHDAEEDVLGEILGFGQRLHTSCEECDQRPAQTPVVLRQFLSHGLGQSLRTLRQHNAQLRGIRNGKIMGIDASV
ncbi:hypothetical protein QU38_02095, partial [Staphylococcus aureus]